MFKLWSWSILGFGREIITYARARVQVQSHTMGHNINYGQPMVARENSAMVSRAKVVIIIAVVSGIHAESKLFCGPSCGFLI